MSDNLHLRTHGLTTTYRAGCRCEPCRSAFARNRYAIHDPADRGGGVTLASTPPPGDWLLQAKCKTAPTGMFFPAKGDNVTCQSAKAICRTCPVLEECRAYALSCPTALSGIWGGLTGKERRDIKARGGRAA